VLATLLAALITPLAGCGSLSNNNSSESRGGGYANDSERNSDRDSNRDYDRNHSEGVRRSTGGDDGKGGRDTSNSDSSQRFNGEGIRPASGSSSSQGQGRSGSSSSKGDQSGSSGSDTNSGQGRGNGSRGESEGTSTGSGRGGRGSDKGVRPSGSSSNTLSSNTAESSAIAATATKASNSSFADNALTAATLRTGVNLSTSPILADAIYTKGPWSKAFAVRNVSAKSTSNPKAYERRTASEPDVNGTWTLSIERKDRRRDSWTLERTLTLSLATTPAMQQGAVGLTQIDDAIRETRTIFSPALVLVPASLVGTHESKSATSQTSLLTNSKAASADSAAETGTAIATAQELANNDTIRQNADQGSRDIARQVRITMSLEQGSASVVRTSNLFLGEHGSIKEHCERTVRYGFLRVDHDNEALVLVDANTLE